MTCKVVPNFVGLSLVQTGIPVKFQGPPGCAKTAIQQALAARVNRGIYPLILSIREPAEIAGYPYPQPTGIEVLDSKTGRKLSMCMETLPPRWVIDTWDGRKWNIFFDEINTAGPYLQATALRVLAERVVGDYPLPRDTWFTLACNPSDQAANGHELSAAMANRMAHCDWEPTPDVTADGFANGLFLDKDGIPEFRYAEPEVPILPDDWHKHAADSGNLVRAFWKAMPGMINKCPSSAEEMAGAWPSQRSWEYALRARTAMVALDAPKEMHQKAMEVCIGFEAANSFATWLDALDLPDIEAEIYKAIQHLDAEKQNGGGHYTLPNLRNRPDVAWAFLGGVFQKACGSNLTQERFEAAGVIFRQMFHKYKEVSIACGKPYGLVAVKHGSWWYPKDAVGEAATLLVECGALG